MVDILIKNGTVVPVNKERSIIKNGAVAIQNGKIVDVGPTADLTKKYSADRIIDASHKAVLPGLINTHTHLLQNFIKGFRDDVPLLEWAERVSIPRIIVVVKDYLAGKFGLQYHATMLGCIEAIKSGTTCLANMEWATHPNALNAYKETGIRADHALYFADQDLLGALIPEARLTHDQTIKLANEIISKWHNGENGRIKFRYGVCSPTTCSESLIREVRELANKTKIAIHCHLGETRLERDCMLEKYGKSQVEWLREIGLLGPDVLAAHCIWLSDREIKILKETQTKVSHNPESNMKLASGIAPIVKMLKEGITVALASDGCASNDNMDMFEAMRTAALLHKVANLDASVLSAYDVLEMATINGARALGLGNQVGSLEPGKKADIILVDLTGVHLRPLHDIVNNLVYCAWGSDVNTVIIDGKMVMENRKMLTINEQETVDKAEEFGIARFKQAGLE